MLERLFQLLVLSPYFYFFHWIEKAVKDSKYFVFFYYFYWILSPFLGFIQYRFYNFFFVDFNFILKIPWI